MGEGGAYLGAVSWVVNDSCLGFLGGGRRHFTMQGRDGLGGEGRGRRGGEGHQGRCRGIATYSMTTNIQKQTHVRTPKQKHRSYSTEAVEHLW